METQIAVLKFALSVQKKSTEFGELHQEQRSFYQQKHS